MIVDHRFGGEGFTQELKRGQTLLNEAFSKITMVPESELLFNTAHSSGSILVLRSGWARRMRWVGEGRLYILDLYLPGDLIGLDILTTRPDGHQVFSIIPSSYQVIPWSKLRALLSNPDVVLQLYTKRNEELKRIEDLAFVLARGDAEQRIAAFLLNLLTRLERQNLVTQLSFRLPLTQKQIGDHLGLTVVSVNRTLRRLREEGVATVRAQCVVIRDMAALCRLAEIESKTRQPLVPDRHGGSLFRAGQGIGTIPGVAPVSAASRIVVDHSRPDCVQAPCAVKQ